MTRKCAHRWDATNGYYRFCSRCDAAQMLDRDYPGDWLKQTGPIIVKAREIFRRVSPMVHDGGLSHNAARFVMEEYEKARSTFHPVVQRILMEIAHSLDRTPGQVGNLYAEYGSIDAVMLIVKTSNATGAGVWEVARELRNKGVLPLVITEECKMEADEVDDGFLND